MVNFIEALDCMKRGKKVRQRYKPNHICEIKDEHILVNGEYANFCHVDWFEGDDWEICEGEYNWNLYSQRIMSGGEHNDESEEYSKDDIIIAKDKIIKDIGESLPIMRGIDTECQVNNAKANERNRIIGIINKRFGF